MKDVFSNGSGWKKIYAITCIQSFAQPPQQLCVPHHCKKRASGIGCTITRCVENKRGWFPVHAEYSSHNLAILDLLARRDVSDAPGEIAAAGAIPPLLVLVECDETREEATTLLAALALKGTVEEIYGSVDERNRVLAAHQQLTAAMGRNPLAVMEHLLACLGHPSERVMEHPSERVMEQAFRIVRSQAFVDPRVHLYLPTLPGAN